MDDAGQRIALLEMPFTGFATAQECFAKLRGVFTVGLYRLHHTWVPLLRKIHISLIRRSTVVTPEYDYYNCAEHILPSLLQQLAKIRCPKPIDFLRSCAENNCADATGKILQLATSLIGTVERAHAQAKKHSATRSRSQRALAAKYSRRIDRLIADGRIGAASQLAEEAARHVDVENAPAPQQRLTIEEMRGHILRLNPVGTERDMLPMQPEVIRADMDGAEVPVIDVDTLRAVLPQLSKGSSSGPSGWTFAAIRLLYQEQTTTEDLTTYLQAIADKFNALIRGDLPRTYWTDSRAVLLPKPDGGQRPLGIGESWYRFMGKAVMQMVSSEVGSALAPMQLGCGISSGGEIGARIAQLYLDAHPDHVLIKTDFKNAFNLTPRQLIYEGLKKYCPQILPLFVWAYGTSSSLLNAEGTEVGRSCTGCRQGDPLSSLLFCVAMQPALIRVQERLQNIHAEAAILAPPESTLSHPHWGGTSAYMDDCTLGCHKDILIALCVELSAIFGDVGLTLNAGKCRIIGQAFQRTGIPDNLPYTYLPEGDLVLGSPVGTDAFRRAKCAELGHSYVSVLPALSKLKINARAAFAIVKMSTNAKMMYLARAGDTYCTEALKTFDTAIDNAIFSLADHKPDLPQQYPFVQQRRQLSATIRSLPLHLGGMGVQRLSWIFGQVGVLKSRAALWRFVDKYYDTLVEPSRQVEAIRLGVGDPLNFIADGVSTADYGDDIDWEEVKETVTMQYEQVAQHTLEHINNRVGSSQAARFRSSQFDGSGRYLTSFDVHHQPTELRLTKDEYRTAFRMRLLLGPFDDLPHANKPRGMCACGKHLLASPTEPFHSIDCGHDAFFIQRHRAGINVLHRYLKNKLLHDTTFVLEPHLHDADGNELLQRGDLSVTEPLLARHHVLDFVAGNPSTASYRHDVAQRNESIVTTAHRITDSHELRKQQTYANTREYRAGQFVAFAVESTGRLGTAARNFMEKTFENTFRPFAVENGACPELTGLQGQLGTALTKIDAQMIFHRARLAMRGQQL